MSAQRERASGAKYVFCCLPTRLVCAGLCSFGERGFASEAGILTVAPFFTNCILPPSGHQAGCLYEAAARGCVLFTAIVCKRVIAGLGALG